MCIYPITYLWLYAYKRLQNNIGEEEEKKKYKIFPVMVGEGILLRATLAPKHFLLATGLQFSSEHPQLLARL